MNMALRRFPLSADSRISSLSEYRSCPYVCVCMCVCVCVSSNRITKRTDRRVARYTSTFRAAERDSVRAETTEYLY